MSVYDVYRGWVSKAEADEHLKNSPHDAFRYKNEDGSIYVPSWSPPVYQYTDDEGKLQSVKKPKGTSPRSQYVDLPYARTNVTKSEVLALIRDVLGLNQSEALPTILDSKVTPVVVLNDYNFTNWVYKWTIDLTVGGVVPIFFSIDNNGVMVYCNNAGTTSFVKDGVVTLSVTGWNDYYVQSMQNYKYFCLINSAGVNDVVNIYKDGKLVKSVDSGLVAPVLTQAFMSKNGKYLVMVDDSVFYCFEGVV